MRSINGRFYCLEPLEAFENYKTLKMRAKVERKVRITLGMILTQIHNDTDKINFSIGGGLFT